MKLTPENFLEGMNVKILPPMRGWHPIWRQQDGRECTMCVGCLTLLLREHGPRCGGCAEQRRAAQRRARRLRKRLKGWRQRA